ncbi:hypothetical protein SAMN05421819_4569 [Bryocella elongata]|uniref:Uncharacterized protein n=1 Tax=Bryocella elongata TaxID=863522 RepID=A0A1H6CHB2_9BACT|nr:hypothetical protein SAMN05421819_4569 [Bryocella elongata]
MTLVYDLYVYRSGGIALLASNNSHCDNLGINIVDPNYVSAYLTLMRVFPTGFSLIVLRKFCLNRFWHPESPLMVCSHLPLGLPQVSRRFDFGR